MQRRSRVSDFVLNASNLVPVALILGLFATGNAAIAQPTGTDDAHIRVQSGGDSLRVEVYKTAPLPEVLRIVCKQEKIECSGVELLSNHLVPAMVIEGKFLQVIGHLIEGTEVNFDYVHGTPEWPAKLVLLGRTPASTQQTVSMRTGDQSHDVNAPAASTPQIPDLGGAAQAPSSSTAAADLAGNPQSSAQSASTQKAAAEMMFAGGNATEATPSAFLPFPGSDGRPIPAKPADRSYLPFPDQFGNPIPVTKPANPAYLPFPDQFGNPIPVVPTKPGSPFPLASGTQALK